MSQEQGLEFHQGEHWVIAATFHDGEGAPIDLSGALEVEWAISTTRSAVPIHTASLANGEVAVVDAAAGRVDIAVPPASQASLPPGIYYHEGRVTTAGGIVSVQFFGALAVRHSVLGQTA